MLINVYSKGTCPKDDHKSETVALTVKIVFILFRHSIFQLSCSNPFSIVWDSNIEFMTSKWDQSPSKPKMFHKKKKKKSMLPQYYKTNCVNDSGALLRCLFAVIGLFLWRALQTYFLFYKCLCTTVLVFCKINNTHIFGRFKNKTLIVRLIVQGNLVRTPSLYSAFGWLMKQTL